MDVQSFFNFLMCRGEGIPFGFGVRLNGAYACSMESSGFAACRGVLTLSGLERPSQAPALRAVASLLQAKGIPPPLDTECKGDCATERNRGRGGGMPFGFGAQLNGTHAWLADEGEFAACRGVLTLDGLGKPYLGPRPEVQRVKEVGRGPLLSKVKMGSECAAFSFEV